MAERSYIADQMKDKLFAILLLFGKRKDGVRCYVYLSVRTDKIDDLLMAHRATGYFEPAHFGKVLHAGEGTPDDAVRERIEKDYGFNHSDYVYLTEK